MPLKTDYFQIAAYRLIESASILELHEKHKKNSAKYEQQFLFVCKILATAYRNNDNFLKNFASRNNQSKLDILSVTRKHISNLQYEKSIQPLFGVNGIPGEAGINLVLNSYRKTAEACVQLMNFLRIAHEFNTGIDKPENEKSAQQNKIILQVALGDALDCYDPHLRNSESHLTTYLDNENHTLIVEDQDGYHAEYSYREVVSMTNDLAHNLLPALFVGVVMETQIVSLILSYRSTEYITALLGVDNS